MDRQFEGKSVEEAIELACKELKVLKNELDVLIVQESSRGFFGIGSKNAIVKVSGNDNYNIRLITEFLSNILNFYDQKADIKVEVINSMTLYSVKIKSENPLSSIIGKHGRTMEAIEHLLSVYINRLNDHHVTTFIDVNDYKLRREDFVRRSVNEAIQKIKKGESRKIELEPMNSHERKIAHEILSHQENIRSYSVEDEPYRHIIIESAKVRTVK